MKNVKLLGAALLCTQLSGCLFVWIPGSVISRVGDAITGSEGDHCVRAAAKVGDKITIPGNIGSGTVMSLSGTSTRCQDARYPVRAKLAFKEE